MTDPLVDDIAPALADPADGRVRTLVNRIFAAIFLVVAIVAIADLWLRHTESVRDGRRNAENLVEVLSEHLAIRLAAIDGALFRVVSSGRRIGGAGTSDREWASILRTAAAGVTGLSSILILDAAGTVRHATLPQLIGQSWADREFFKALESGSANQLAVDRPFAMLVGNQRLIPFGRAITDPTGKFGGAAVAILIPNQLEEFYRAFDLGENGIAWVLLNSGAVVFRADSAATRSDPDPGEPPLFVLDNQIGGTGVVRGPVAPDGDDYLTVYRGTDIANLVVAVSLAESGILSTWYREAAAGGVLVIVAAALLYFAARRIRTATGDAIASASTDAGIG